MTRRNVEVLLCLSILAPGGIVAAAERGEGRLPAQAYYLDHEDVSRPLREITPRPPRARKTRHSVRMLHPPRPFGTESDALLRAAAPQPQVATTPGLNLDGVGVGLAGFSPNSAPPDTNGSVGDTQYVQWVNTSLAVFNKATGALVYGPAAGNTLWDGFGGPCELNNDGDPIAIYDKAANRWVMTQFALGGPPYYQCIAVSTTSDATGSYRRFAYQFNDLNDYPKLGVWPDAYYVTFNMFTPVAGGYSFVGGRACAVDRNQMLTPSGTPGPIVCFQLSTTYGGLLPADLDGATAPPAGAPNYHLAYDFNTLNRLLLWKFQVDFDNPGASTFAGPTAIPVTAFTEACGGGACVRQRGTSQRLASLGDRLMYRLAYRNLGTHEALLANHSVNVGSRTGIRWYELRNPGGAPSVHQSGTYSPDSRYRWMGSMAMDQAGNIALGYSVSAGNLYPAARYTGRTPGDPLGTLQSETSIVAGAGSQTLFLNRWGDYSTMSLDPVDDCTFYFTTEYLKSSGTFNWSTRIASFKFPSCGAPTDPDFGISVTPSALSVTQGGSASTTVTVSSVAGFSSATNLSVSGLPAGVTASFSPNPVTPPAGGNATSTLTFSAGAAPATGTFTVAVTGTSGTLTHSTTVDLSVSSGQTPDFTLSLMPTSQTIPRGSTASYTVNVNRTGGFTGAVTLSLSPAAPGASFSPNPTTGSASTLTIPTSSANPPGTYSFTVTGTSGSLTRTVTGQITLQ